MSISNMVEEGRPPPLLLRYRIRIAREHAGLEQDELASEIGVSRNTISNAENGNVTPRLITLNMIALATKIPVSYFVDAPDYLPPTTRRREHGKVSQLPCQDSSLEPFGCRHSTALALTG